MQVYVWKNGTRRTVEVEAAVVIRSLAEASSTEDDMRVPAIAERSVNDRTRMADVRASEPTAES
jgi:hypothetical protein